MSAEFHLYIFFLKFLEPCYFEAFMGRLLPPRDLVNLPMRHLKFFDHHLCRALLLKSWGHVSPTGWDETTRKGEHSYLKHLNPQKLRWWWKITISNRRYIFIHGCFSFVMLVFGGESHDKSSEIWQSLDSDLACLVIWMSDRFWEKKYNPISAKLQTMRQAKPTWFHWNRKDYQTYGLQTHIIQDTRYCSPSSLFEEKGETRRDAEDFNEHTQIDWSLRARPCKVKYGRSQKAVSSSNHLSEPFALNFRFFFKHQKHGLFQQNGPFAAH